MTNKDVLKILLCHYGYDRNIKIDTYRGVGGCVGYDIHAENKDGEEYSEISCEGFMFHVYMILNHMKETNASFESKWWGIRAKDLCDDEVRNSLVESWDKQEESHKEWAIKNAPIDEWHKKNNPCPTCTINKKDHWDDIHYNCELYHTHSCSIMIEHYEKLTEMRRRINNT